MGGDTISILDGSTFVVSDRRGDIDAGPDQPHGLFYRDTRFLSEMELRVNGQVPEPLAATTTDPFSASFVLRDHPLRGRADSHLVVSRHRYVGRGMLFLDLIQAIPTHREL